ncbi:MAG TPA: alkaline phosphatase family protein [Bryobacteraceae bacterium]|nr:alkaline phosphatase family protein [Bryobacteraceae bacterium]
MTKTAVLNVVGLTPEMLGPRMPLLSAWASKRRVSAIRPAFPAVTCTAQATYYTGVMPAMHGIVANGWYFQDDCEIHFWRQSNKLVQAPKVWEIASQLDPRFTCANLFGWYNMYSSVNFSITPRPIYPADGRKIPDVYTQPASLRSEIQQELGTFPLFEFWGPRTSINSTRWIAEAAKYVDQRFRPALSLIYLPHLDYNLQRIGPDAPAISGDLAAVDQVCGDLIRFYESRDTQVVVLSEYGIIPVDTPVHINRALREAGLLQVREELGFEVLDPGASEAFAVADHQVAHVYVNNHSKRNLIRAVLERMPGLDMLLDDRGMREYGINHPRAGEFVAIAKKNAWFTYFYWLDDRKAPDFARTVDIHRKPGYDPVELFLDPSIKLPTLKIACKLLKRKLGFRNLLDVIPLDASLVKGSHGRIDNAHAQGPLFIGNAQNDEIAASEICGEILTHLGFDTRSQT